MKASVEERLCHVLLIYKAMIPSIRLCGHMQMQALAEKGLIEYQYAKISELQYIDENWPDVVLIGRLDNQYERSIVKAFSQKKRRLIYILDDDLLNVPKEITSSAYYQLNETKKNIREMIALSCGLLTPSKVLQNKYAINQIRGMLTEEPAVDAVEYRPHAPDRAIKIGFAGSIDRIDDLQEILGGTLIRLKQEYGERVELNFFGAIPDFARKLDATVIPYSESYDEYREKLNAAQWDIGLAPLPDTAFHSCKHYNKFIEYAAAGIIGVYSDCGPYTRLREEIGIGCFCKNNAEAWYEAIKQLIDHREMREKMREQACLYAHEQLNIGIIAQRLFDENKDIWTYHAPEENKTKIPRSNRILRFISKVKMLILAYKWRLPVHIYYKIIPPILIKLYAAFDRKYPKGSRVRNFVRKIARKPII